MTESEIVTLAARAASISGVFSHEASALIRSDVKDEQGQSRLWNPIRNKFDAMDLVLHLKMDDPANFPLPTPLAPETASWEEKFQYAIAVKAANAGKTMRDTA